jgi:hypothetical protein
MAKRGHLVTGAAFFLLFFVFTACSLDPGVDYISLPKDIPEDSTPPSSDAPYKEVSNLILLINALEDETTDNIRIADNITLSGISEIPVKKNLEIMEQKTLTINEKITISGAISIMDDANMWIQSDAQVTFHPASRFNIAPRGTVITGSQADIISRGTVTVQGQIALGSRATLTVDRNLDVEGDITVGTGAELIIGKDVQGRINGTVTVLNGGQIRDSTPDGSWSRNKNGTGAIILKHGSFAYISLDSTSKQDVDVPVIGPLANASLLMLTSTLSEVTLLNNGYLLEGDGLLKSDFTLKRGEMLMIRNGTLETSPGKTFSLEEGALFVIENQAFFEIKNSNNGPLNGTVEVRKDGKFVGQMPMGTSFFSRGGTGSLVVHTDGVVAGIGATGDEKIYVGTNGGDAKGQVIQLEAGTIEIKNNDEYVLDGSAKLVADWLFKKLTLSPLSVLRVIENTKLQTSDAANSLEGQFSEDNAAQIVLVSDTSKIVNSSNEVFCGPKMLTAGLMSGWK